MLYVAGFFFVCLFVVVFLLFFICFYVVRSLEKQDFVENSYILSCFVQLKSVVFNLLCVLVHNNR